MKVIPCTEATFLISKRQETSLEWREGYDLIVHLFFCKFCRRFFEQTRRIVSTIRQLASDNKLTADEKRKMRETLGLH